MSRLMRLFSGRWQLLNGDQPNPQGKQGSAIICQVRFLDGTQVDFDVPVGLNFELSTFPLLHVIDGLQMF